MANSAANGMRILARYGAVGSFPTCGATAEWYPGVINQPWQLPGPGLRSRERADLHVEIDISGRKKDRRSDFGQAYGDWASVSEHARRTATSTSRTSAMSAGGSGHSCHGDHERCGEDRPFGR